MYVHEGDTEKQGNTSIQMREWKSGGRSMFILALIVQVLLTALCLAFSMYSLWTVQPVTEETGIFLEMPREVRGPVEKLKLRVHWKHGMDIKRNTTIIFPCSGPYLFHLSVCSEDNEEQKDNRTLILQQDSKDWMTITLHSQNYCGEQTAQNDQRILSFAMNDSVSIKFTSTSVILRHLRLGFRYMLGKQCF